ncbi:hypothetical protein N9I58_02110 [Candidatus Thioglobus sp.]|nr:hypothetical protein [Candidatus Thioglobus sp.]
MVQFYKVIFLIIFTYPAFGISVSVNSNCDNAIPYNFDQFAYDSDFVIQFNPYGINADYIFKVLPSKDGADVVVQDGITSDLSVCKSNKGKVIKISDYGYDPDVTVKISNYAKEFDFTIYNNSILSIKEVISILVIPKFSIIDLEN